MADKEKDKPAPPEGEKKSAGVSRGALLFSALAVILGSVLSGGLLAPLISAKINPPPKFYPGAHGSGEGGGEHEEKEDEPVEVAPLDPIVVDIRDDQGVLHHLKMGVSVELAKAMPEEEIKKLMPRARDAAIEYTRALPYTEVIDNKRFGEIRKELLERVTKALGKSRVKKVNITDFVVQ